MTNTVVIAEDTLIAQAEYITRMYTRITGRQPILRLKDEVAIYPLAKIWLTIQPANLHLFCRLVRKGNRKFPENDVAFILNLLPILKEQAAESVTASWYHGYFISIVEAQTRLLLDFIKDGEI